MSDTHTCVRARVHKYIHTCDTTSENAKARFFITFFSTINKYSILFLYIQRWNTVKRTKKSSTNFRILFFNRNNHITLITVKWTNGIKFLIL